MTVLIACHATADFDALAGMCGMAALHPGAKLLMPGGAGPSVNAFLKEFPLPAGELIGLKSLDGLDIERLILVDCHDPEQLGPLTKKLPRPLPPVTVVDHHPGATPVAGASTTLVVERLQAAGAQPGPPLATLLLLGLYEDTGRLTHNDVKPLDAAMASWLMGYRPDYSVIRRYLDFHGDGAPELLLALLQETELLSFGKIRVALVNFEPEREKDAEQVSAAVERLNDVLALTRADGAVLLSAARGRVNVAARGDGRRFDAGALMADLGGGGHPTAASAALAHTPKVAARQALLAALHRHFPLPRGHRENSAAPSAGKPSRLAPEYIAARLRKLPQAETRLLKQLVASAGRAGQPVYLVGGPVRDLVLGLAPSDLDVAVALPLSEFLAPLAKAGRVTVRFHDRFHTAVITHESGFTLDVARTRREQYPQAGALPDVAPDDLHTDLGRRDFTLNAMAIRLRAGEQPAWIDPLGGLSDLRAGKLRVLHAESFLEDPTRMLRAVRFLTRFHFSLAPDSERLLKEAVRRGALQTVSGARRMAELDTLAAGPEPLRALEWLDQLGLLAQLLPGAAGRGEPLERARRLYARVQQHRLEFPEEVLDLTALFLMPLLAELKPDALQAALQGLPLAARRLGLLTGLRDRRWRLEQTLAGGKEGDAHEAFDALETESLLWLAAEPGKKSPPLALWARRYLGAARFLSPKLTGKELLALGVKPGPALGAHLRALKAAVRAGEVSGRRQETAFIRRRMNDA
jgi:tRNA nucleotidyltransferase (CCA-adding enzyme)